MKGLLNRFRIRKTHTKLILTLLCISFLLSAVLSVSLFSLFRRTTLEIARRNSANSLGQNVSQVRLIQENTFSLGLQLINDPLVTKAIFSTEELSPVEDLRLYRRVRSILTGDSMVRSVCFYNASTGQFHSYFDVESSESYQEAMLTLLSQYEVNGEIQFFPCRISYQKVTGSIQTDHVITAIITDSYYGGEGEEQPLTSAVLISLNADVMRSTLMSDQPGSLSDTLIVNRQGLVVFSSDMDRMGRYLPEDDYAMNLLRENATGGSAVATLEGERSLVVYSSVDNPGWLFLNVYPFGELFRELDSLRVTVVFVAVLVIVFSAVYAVMMSRRIYSPFQSLLDSAGGPGPDRGEGTDMEYLTATFDSLTRRARMLESAYRENRALLKREYLSRLMKGYGSEASGGEELAAGLAGAGPYAILAVELNGEPADTARQLRGSAGDLFFSSVEILAAKAIGQHYACEPVEYAGRCLYLLVGAGGVPREEVREKLERVHGALRSSIGQPLCFSLGEPVEDLTEIHRSYGSARSLLRYRFVHGLDSFLTSDREAKENRVPYLPIDREKLIKAIRACNGRETEKLLGEIFENLAGCQYDFIHLTLHQMMFDLVKAVYRFYETDSTQVNFDHITRNLGALRTMEEAQEFFLLYCSEVIHKIEIRKNALRSNTIDEMTRYISLHYADYELSADSLAEMVRLSPGYFGKLFRENVGKSVSEYINSCRLEAARELLEQSGETVNRISTQVGFNNPTYFITLFKKQFGMSPNHYRKERSQPGPE